MTTPAGLAERAAALSDHESELLLQEVLDDMLTRVGDLQAQDEESARELLAAFVSRQYECRPEDFLRPTTAVPDSVRRMLSTLAADPETCTLVESHINRLPEEKQMFADPVTAGVVLVALVAFLQTKFDISVSRKDGKVDFSFGVSKEAASDEVVEQVVKAVAKVGGV